MTFLGDGNDFAWSICIVIPLAFFLAQVSESRLIKYFYWSVACSLVLAVIGTQSRGASIALAVSILYFVLKGSRKILGLLGIGILVICVSLFAPAAYFERMDTLRDYESEGSAMGRIMAWKSAVRMAVDHPFMGVGAGHFPVKYGIEYRPPGIGRTDIPWSNAHSIYFLCLGEFGLTGLLFLFGFIISNLQRNNKRMRDVKNCGPCLGETEQKLSVAMQSSFIAFIVGGAFLSGLYYPHIYFLGGLMESVYLLTTPSVSKENLLQMKNLT